MTWSEPEPMDWAKIRATIEAEADRPLQPRPQFGPFHPMLYRYMQLLDRPLTEEDCWSAAEVEKYLRPEQIRAFWDQAEVQAYE